MAKLTLDIFTPPRITLTLVPVSNGSPCRTIKVEVSRLISCDQCAGFTRLKLTGSKVLEVKESVGQIDHLLRVAASGGFPALL